MRCKRKVSQMYINCSLILFLCTILPLNSAKSKDDDDDDASNVMLLGSDGELTSSRYVPRKPDNAITIFGTGSDSPDSEKSVNSQINPGLMSTSLSLSSLDDNGDDDDDEHQQSTTLSQRFVHKPLSKEVADRLWKHRRDGSDKCDQSSKNCNSILTGFIPIMIPYVSKKSRRSRSGTRKIHKAQESKLGFRKMSPEKSRPNKPQMIIRKTISSPPIVIEEAKEPVNSYINFHATSRANDYPIPSSTNQLSKRLTSTVAVNQNSDQPISSRPIGLNKMHNFNRLNNHDELGNRPKGIYTNSLIKSIDTPSNPPMPMKNFNYDDDYFESSPGYQKKSALGLGSKLRSHSYNVPVSVSIKSFSDDDLSTRNEVNENNDEVQEIYDEKLFDQFDGFDQVSSIDLTNLPGEEQLPNLFMATQGTGNELESRNDPMNNVFGQGFLSEDSFDHSFGPRRINDHLGKVDLNLLLNRKLGWGERGPSPTWLVPI